ncbi:hypothetical protein Tco_0786442 [Tanacetum coccineum]
MTTLQFADTHNLVGFCLNPLKATVKVTTVNEEVQLQALVDGKKIIVIEASIRRDLQLNDEEGMDCLPNATIFEELTRMGLERAATTATSLDAEQDRGNINKTQSKATLNEASYLGTSSGSGPMCQETMGDTIAQIGFENVSKTSNDSLLVGVNTPRIIDLEKTKSSQAQEITSLKRRVKRLEKKGGSRTYGLKRLYKVSLSRRVESSEDEGLGEEDASKQRRIADIDADVVVETEVAFKDVNLSVDEVTLAQALAALKSAKPKADKVMLQEPLQGTITTTTVAITITAASTRPKAKGLVIHEQEQAHTPTVSSQQPLQLNVQDKGKGKMVEPEPVKKLSKKDQLMLDEELAFKLQAEEEEEERLAREKAQQIEEANIVSWDHIYEEGKHICKDGYRIESAKKQKVDEDRETTELKRLIEVMPDEEEVALDAIPLAVKSSSIVDRKIHKKGKKSYYQIIRADGSSKMYLVFSHMLKSFDKEDLETLYKLVKAKYGSTRPVEDLDLVLYRDLKTMFEPHVEDNVWKKQSDYRVLDWKNPPPTKVFYPDSATLIT